MSIVFFHHNSDTKSKIVKVLIIKMLKVWAYVLITSVEEMLVISKKQQSNQGK